MPKSDVSFASAIESRTRGIYVDLLRDNPGMTLGDLQQLCKGEFGKVLSTITLGELFAGGKATKAAAAPARAASQGAKAKAAKAKPGAKKAAAPADKAAGGSATAEVNTRTPAGRQAFDEAVFAAIKSFTSPAGAGAIQKVTGGTNMQVRSACNRLIEAGRVSWSGKARGTRYHAA